MTATEAAPTIPVHDALDCLRGVLGDQATALRQIGDRLAPVLTPIPANDCAPSIPPPAPCECELARAIRELTSTAALHNDALIRLTSRLEV